MKKKLLSLLLAMCMVLCLVPTTVFAEGETEETPVCICETACTEETMNAECSVCGAEGALAENCGKYIKASAENTTLSAEGEDAKEKTTDSISYTNGVDDREGNSTVQENVSVGNLVYTLRSDATAAVTGGKFDSNGYITIPAQIQADGKTYIVTEVAKKAFYDASSAKGITLPKTLRVIGEKAFYNAASYIRGKKAVLTIPDSVVEIGEGAFAENDFDKIIIGEGLKNIPSGAFKGISFMTDDVELVIGSQVTSISTDAFDDGTVTKVTVKGETGRLDTVLELVSGLKNAKITYDDPNALTSDWLQDQINAAQNGVSKTITINGPLTITKTVTVPKEKDIVLIDDGQTRTLSSSTEQMFEVKGRLTIDATAESNRLIFRGSKTENFHCGNIAKITDGGELTLKDGVFCDGEFYKSSYSGAILVGDDSSFKMSGGVIKNFKLNADVLTGAVVVTSGGDFQMSGGIIENNSNTDKGSAHSGGGVLLYSWDKGAEDATMTMSGNAVIRNNTSPNGGGVYLVGNTNFDMEGGSITDNKANKVGGGICVAGTGAAAGAGGAPASESKFTMHGGEISNNHAGDAGGGIYINSDDVVLKGGKIENNTAGRLGGGVYVSEPPQKVEIYNAVVTQNEASVMGGGLWTCPTGDSTFAVTNGIAVYNNKANQAGDDLVALGGDKGTITLTDRFLGGGPVEWYSDGAVIGQISGSITPPQNIMGSVDDTIQRFDSLNPGEQLTNISGSGNYALKAVVSDNTIKLAESQTKLWITGNKAGRGGGIGSNGAVLLGEQKDYTLQVTKKWSENTPENDKKEICVFLKIGEYQLDSVRLNAENDWTADFTQLPDPESLNGNLQYAVIESPVPANFTPIYQDAVIVGNKIYITITNNYVPEHTSGKVTKTWADNNDQDGIRPKSITVKLMADGKDTKKNLVLNSGNNWTASFRELDKYKDGNEIVYTIEEVRIEGYETSVTGNATTGFTITNSHTPEITNISGSKTWDDANNQDGKRPDSITIRLYANGKQAEAINVTAKDGWKWNFTNLPKYENGSEIRYTITEDMVSDYQSEINGMNVINHYSPHQVSISVTKNWQDKNDADGIRPDFVTVKLYANGKDTGKKLVLNQDSNWTGSFDNLDEYADGMKILYTITEINVEGYDMSISGSAETGFVISNRHIPEEHNNFTPPDGSPRTGDYIDLSLWVSLLVVSGASLITLFILTKKKFCHKKHTK